MNCKFHDDRESVDKCSCCGAQICDECKAIVEGKTVCMECTSKPKVEESKKNPFLAAFLSLIFPGSGQMYNGQIGKGVLFLFTAWLVVPWLISIIDAYKIAGKINNGEKVAHEKNGCLIGLFILGGFFPLFMIMLAVAIPNFMRAQLLANEQLVQRNLSVMAEAAEQYHNVHIGEYPVTMEELTSATPPYIDNDYCGQTVEYYSYECEMSKAGYTFSARPSKSYASTFTIVTGGVLSSERKPVQEVK